MSASPRSMRVDSAMRPLEIGAFLALVLIVSTACAFWIGIPRSAIGAEEADVWRGTLAISIIGIPMLMAILCALIFRGMTGLKQLWSRFSIVKLPLSTYLLAFFTLILVNFTMDVLASTWLGVPLFDKSFSALAIEFVVLFALLTIIMVGEEVGWRGYALPGLQAYMSPFWATIILGLVWGAWHFPIQWGFFVGVTGEEIYGWIGVIHITIFILLYAFVFTWLFNSARGAVIPCMIMHGANNATIRTFSLPEGLVENARGAELFEMLFIGGIPLFAAAILIVALNRGMFFNRLEG